MTVREDALRALEYGKSAYYQHIQGVPSYQKELERVRRDYNERTWIDFTGFLPKFSTEEFNKRRDKYQSKYGNTVNIPGFSDVIHIVPKAKISAEERAAHLWATKRGLPSPLTPAQQETMVYKKFRFLKALASATPTWMKNYGALATVLDNVEDGLVTVSILGRIAAKIAPRLLGRAVPVLGWVLMGSDILNAVNLFSWATIMTRGCKKLHGDMVSKNPFHAKAAASRALKLKRTIPTFGETLEILQTTDQLFGIGLCLGGLMGIVTDTASKAMTYSAQEEYLKMPKTGNLDELTRWSNKGMATDIDKFKKTLTDQWSNFKDEAYRLKATDIELRQKIFDWSRAKSKETWDWIKSTPGPWIDPFTAEMMGAMIMSTGKDDFLKEDHTKAYMMLDSAVQGLMPWWIENDPVSNFKDLRGFKFRAPEPRDPTTIDFLEEKSLDWKKTVKWPHLDKEYATIEEIAFTYAPMIKDSFQTYCLKYQHEWEAYVAASQAVDFIKNIIRSYSDDNQVRIGYDAYLAAAIDMMDQVYIMEPDTPKASIDALADYIGNHERLTGGAPQIHDVAKQGELLGIKWMRTFPKRAFEEAAEIFPEWKAIQEQIEEIFVSD